MQTQQFNSRAGAPVFWLSLPIAHEHCSCAPHISIIMKKKLFSFISGTEVILERIYIFSMEKEKKNRD